MLARVVGAYELRARAVLLCSLPASVSMLLLATLPGVARPAWVLPFRLLSLGLLVLVAVTLVRRRLSARGVSWFSVYAQGVFAALALGVSDPQLQTVLSVAVLVPPLFVGIVAEPREVFEHVLLAVVCAVALTSAGAGGTTLPEVVCVVLLVTCPSAIVMVMRHQLDAALRTAERSAVTDPLTGLLNRRGMGEQLPVLLASVQRQDALLAVLVIDVDRFKSVNDRYGHGRGDGVLVSVARTVRACARVGDLVVRLGGEELLVLAQVDSDQGAAVVAERVRRAVEEARDDLPVTVSVGVASGRVGRDDPVPTVERLIAAADEQMYAAKADGRNRVRAAGSRGLTARR